MRKQRFVEIMNECGITDADEIDRCWASACRISGVSIESTPAIEAMRETSLRRTILEIYIPGKNTRKSEELIGLSSHSVSS